MDLEQTHTSLRPYLIEEAYEVIEAIDAGDMDHLREELGDLLLQVVFHAQLAGEREEFTVSDVIAGITEKLIRRHPHVFGDVAVSGSADVVRNWEAIKGQEQGNQGPKSLLAKVGKGLPALPKAYALQKQAAKVGFDWPDVGGALDKLCEEAEELREAWQQGDAKHVEEELGDLLFGAGNVARKLKLDPELALAGTNAKFMRRFRYIEEQAQAQGRQVESMSLEEMDALWEAAKRLETKKN